MQYLFLITGLLGVFLAIYSIIIVVKNVKAVIRDPKNLQAGYHKKQNIYITLAVLGGLIAGLSGSGHHLKLYEKIPGYNREVGTWLIVDNSSWEEPVRHWLLSETSVKQKDGYWTFKDEKGNDCYVPTSFLLIKVNEPVKDFEIKYKGKFNIPKKQTPLK
jgi:hypothetical protein